MKETMFALLNGAFLFMHSITDMREKRIRIWPCMVYIGFGFLLHLLLSDGKLRSAMAGAGIGIVLFFAAWVTRQAIGYGDCLVILACAVMTGMRDICCMLFLAMLLSSVWSAVLILRKQANVSDTIPFVPFLLAAQILMLMAGFFI